jgi:hypothetical protein
MSITPLPVYIYPDEVAFPWPEDTRYPLLRVPAFLDTRHFTRVDNPEEAAWIFYPFVLDPLFYKLWESVNWMDEDWSRVVNWLQALPLMGKYEGRHVFVIHYDHDVVFGLKSVFLRCSLSKTWKDERAFAIPFPMQDIRPHQPAAPQFVTSFQGARGTSVVRRKLSALHQQFQPVPHHFLALEHFFGGFQGSEAQTLRQQYLDVLNRSITVLCPRGTGRNSIRFFETLCVGKIPVLLSDDAALPYEDLIPYDAFVIRVPEAEVGRTMVHIAQFIQQKGPDGVMDAGKKARECWEAFLSNEAQPEQYFRLLSGLA